VTPKTKETRTLSHEHNNTPKGAMNSVSSVISELRVGPCIYTKDD